ncbi:hypothetical protein CC1G_12745 [Coprinopsis cinerea okayama7|uniref:CxC1-like cysteine cluster associated with KDZ transposases domain-containing protein n=1 Tax=Coprinopsis cinerea (strain Okayama-7 / 130 / ATCC MYA-4618 / FGSC 9003) TaxID=240176 RepID=A8NZB0_COPC7|nr:hypothetical protein CC1G_12745 [Coprinopsis cinerea okayama7\|eukprot:XP_001837640.2 hypothetical protein CC1G_12745 [Coprinopsis cinerea okayama7\
MLKKVETKTRRAYGTASHRLPMPVDISAPSGGYYQDRSRVRRAAVFSSPRRQPTLSPRKSRSPAKPREAKHIIQYRRWVDGVIPTMIPHYLRVLRESNQLRDTSQLEMMCECSPNSTRTRVLAVYQHGVEELHVCNCSPAVLLVQRGLFPSSPVRPAFAVDLRMLDFMHELYARSALNLSAWSATLETVLARQGFKVKGQDVIRRKMATAVKWYTYMVAQKDAVINSIVWDAARPIEGPLDIEEDYECEEHVGEAEGDDWVDEGDGIGGLMEPSRYLQERCPLCFNNQRNTRDCLSEVLLCLDANFTQKRRNPARGQDRSPPLTHPLSVFLTADEVSEAKAYVERLRPSEGAATATPAVGKEAPLAEDDTMEEGMKVPTSVLNGCLQSFTAADEKRTKASTRLFADTGLMALLCRHDRVLWLANMTSAGERQFYAIALLQKFFNNVPIDMTVGLLYDVACQLHRSCMKWGFLGDVANRIRWSVSVFHAYGHQWGCQVVYHPRKCLGFGLSDGEGCERFWAAIKILIPALRVSGYHQRLFAIDNQVSFLDKKSFASLGRWIERKWNQCRTRKRESLEVLARLKLSRAYLQQQWDTQVEMQTKPLAKVSEHAAKRAVQEILSLNKLRDGYKAELAKISRRIKRNDVDVAMDMEDLTNLSLALTTKLAETTETIAQRRKALGATAKHSLERLSKSDFLKHRLNAAALKERICAKLRARKFELERLDKASRSPGSTDNKLQAHIQAQVSRHEPSVVKLVKRYNDVVASMEDLIHQRRAPRNAVAPKSIPKERLFSLDIDDPIWDMRGLEDTGEGSPPAWLADDNVIKGIRAHLALQRCEEEESRLEAERAHLQIWCRSTWDGLNLSILSSNNPDLVFELRQRCETLLGLVTEWSELLVDIPGDDGLGWGPTDEDIADFSDRATQGLFVFQFGMPRSEGTSVGWNNDSLVEEEEEEEEWFGQDGDDLLEIIDDVYLGELYGDEEQVDAFEGLTISEDDVFNGASSSSILGSPRKRLRAIEDDI